MISVFYLYIYMSTYNLSVMIHEMHAAIFQLCMFNNDLLVDISNYFTYTCSA